MAIKRFLTRPSTAAGVALVAHGVAGLIGLPDPAAVEVGDLAGKAVHLVGVDDWVAAGASILLGAAAVLTGHNSETRGKDDGK